MTARIRLFVDDNAIDVDAEITVAAALLNLGCHAFRRSVTGEPRAPLCGMGICFECRVTIDDVAHRRACLAIVRDGMRVKTATHD